MKVPRVVGSERAAFRLLVAIAAVLFVLYGLYGLVLPLTPGFLSKPSAALIEDLSLWSSVAGLVLPGLDDPLWVGAALLTGVVAAFALYALAVTVTWRLRGRRLLAVAVVASALFSIGGALAQPNLNRNIYNFIMRGRVLGVYGANPYGVAVDAYRDDPLYAYANPRYTAEPTGKLPAWELLSGALARLAGDDPTTSLLVYRFAFALANLGTLALLAAALARLRPERVVAGIVLWGWNPIVVAYAQSKTDILMIFYLAAAALLLLTSRRRAAAVALTLSIFVKLLSLPLLAVAALGELRRGRWRELLLSGLVVLATIAVLYAPFWSAGGPSLLLSHLGLLGSESGHGGGAGLALAVRIGFGLLILVVGLLQNGDERRLLQGWTLVSFYFSLLIAKFGSADYLFMMIALVALTQDWRAVAVSIVLGLATLAVALWYQVQTPEMPLPDLIDAPTWLLYLIVSALAAVGVLMVGFVRNGRRVVPARVSVAGSELPVPAAFSTET